MASDRSSERDSAAAASAARRLRLAAVLAAMAAFAWGLSFKLGWVAELPLTTAGFASAALLLAAMVVVVDTVLLVRGALPLVRSLGRLIAAAGLIAALGAGLANWLLGYQAAVVLSRGERVSLSDPDQVDVLEAGPLARWHELDLELELVNVELAPDADGRVVPSSVVRLHRRSGDPTEVTIAPGASHRTGAVRLFQGAFGFSPRLVVTADQRTVLDRVVPFTTRREAGGKVEFSGQVEVEDLTVDAVVDLASLDANLRGHSSLAVVVTRAGRELGRGALRMGHFADLPDGYRVGFAGLERWSEIDISRTSYPRTIATGLGAMLVGGVLWLVGVIVKR